jgi:hypothetical protein
MRLACLHSNTTYCCIWLVRFAYPLPPTSTAHVHVQILLYYGIFYFSTLLLYYFCTAPSKTLATSSRSRSSACLIYIYLIFPRIVLHSACLHFSRNAALHCGTMCFSSFSNLYFRVTYWQQLLTTEYSVYSHTHYSYTYRTE